MCCGIPDNDGGLLGCTIIRHIVNIVNGKACGTGGNDIILLRGLSSIVPLSSDRYRIGSYIHRTDIYQGIVFCGSFC